MKTKTKEEKDYHEYIASLPCVACGDSPVHVHHCRFSAGIGQRGSHYFVLPLCPACHQGKEGIHGSPKIFEMRNGSEEQLLATVIQQLWSFKNDV